MARRISPDDVIRLQRQWQPEMPPESSFSKP
jgi:hypothetical protein